MKVLNFDSETDIVVFENSDRRRFGQKIYLYAEDLHMFRPLRARV